MDTMLLTPKKLFLIDFTGALLSAILLGVVLVKFESFFGMPRKVLYFLSITACIFAVYSFLNYLLVKENHKFYLKIIAFANALYCCITAILAVSLSKELTHFGLLYFVIEIVIISALAITEFKIASKSV